MSTVTESVGGHLGKDVVMTSDVERSATGDAGRLDERVHRTSLANKEANRIDASTRSDPLENGKKKPKEEKPPSKVVIRRLPPSMTKDVFISQISPVPKHDYLYFVPGDPTMGSLMGFSRAYINFINQEDLFQFTETYDNYVFVDSKGQEFPAIVEFAPFQRIPKQRSKKKDQLSGCIETDPVYLAFKESLEAAAAEAAKPDVTSKQHFFETEVTPSTPQEMATTPLLEFLKQKRVDRARIRDERKEERKRKEAERKLRQKAIKEKKDAEEEQHKDIKLLQPKDKKDSNNKESRNGRRPEKEKPPKEIRPREFRNRSNKNFSEEKTRAEKKEDRKKDGGGADKKDDKKEIAEKEVKDEVKEKVADDSPNGNVASDKGKGGGGDRRRGGERKKFEVDSKGGEGGEESAKKNRSERSRSIRKEKERKRRDDYLAKKNLEKRNNEGADKKKSRAYKNSNNGTGEPGGVSDSKDKGKEGKETKDDAGERVDGSPRLTEKARTNEGTSANNQTHEKSSPKTSKRRSSLELTPEYNKTSGEKCQPKRRNSLESGSISGFSGHKGSSREQNRRGGGKRRQHEGVGDDKRGVESDSGGEKSMRNREDKASRSDQDDCKKDEKDTRPARRIRNKDRPSIQIYRPGMGKLSKQRLEKEKTLGSSTEVDSPSHSPSPVPKSKPPAPS